MMMYKVNQNISYDVVPDSKLRRNIITPVDD